MAEETSPALFISALHSESFCKRLVKLTTILGIIVVRFSAFSVSGNPKRFSVFIVSCTDGGNAAISGAGGSAADADAAPACFAPRGFVEV